MREKKACTHCGQDWVKEYKRADTGQVFHMCPECESVWLDKNCIDDATELYLSEFMGSGDSVRDWESITLIE
ncbi:hypothetical protein ACFY12_13495 [Streptomyces sp. NPDC001339]|uniref:hypothetical protein n=1 Tax=Streptomyces sp. NPDC001339 TaxID=3364563 RepID=UPI0036A56BAD